MADRNDRDAMAQDLDIDEKQSEEVTGGANVLVAEESLVDVSAAKQRVIDKLPSAAQIPHP
jgi:hypothetical protein